MRAPLTVLALLLSPPALAAAPQCALADTASAAKVVTPFQPPAEVKPSANRSGGEPMQEDLSNTPFIRHVVSAGAKVTELGVSHGMRLIAASNGKQFMLFQITPDGQAAVSGALTDLTFDQLTTAAGGDVTPISAQHGLKGLFVRSGAQFQVFYETPDGQRVIPGVMWDAAGKDLTRGQVALIPGAFPTVVVGDVPAGNAAAAPAASAQTAAAPAALPLLQKAAYGTVGSPTAPHLWMLIDPQCIYSIRAYQILHPYVQAGQLQLTIIPIDVLDYEDKGQSRKSALALLSKPAAELASSWQAGSVNDPPTAEAAGRLQANMSIAQAIGLQGTPTLVWRKSDGTEGRIDGLPTNVAAMIASIGS